MRRSVRIALIAALVSASAGAWLHGRSFSADVGLTADAEDDADDRPIVLLDLIADAGTPLPDAGVDAGHDDASNPAPVIAAPNPPGPPADFDATDNVLLVGFDVRPGKPGIGRADSIVLLAVDGDEDRAALVSIPRDLLVDVPGHGLARVNAVPRIARRLGDDPLDALRRVVSDTLAVPIGHVVAIDLGAFESMVDAVGGVEVDVPCPIVDVFHDPRMDGGLRTLALERGLHHLDGATAAMYARSRHGRSDFSRARRQQAVLLALRAKLLAERSPAHVQALYESLARTVRTDLTRIEALGLALTLSKVGVERLHGVVLGARAVTPAHTEDGRSVLVPKPEGIAATLATAFDAPSPGALPPRHACHDADVAIRPATGSLRRRDPPRSGR